ncbi:MAG: haloacid dehalogenase [Ignavibacteriae bacterium HGW-Ignavibacteriae-2]|jgi:phosphoglycolate phosphatase-like HAD superfamily hydrolase|nr:MAG: haloacid dehalogenase [Ignavibacteriae bacterium HGW-Ignavibacteriae-2]
MDPHKILEELKPTKEFFIGIDSDGCAFDTMEIKHKECFCPNTINYWHLQKVSKYVREAWDFVNLYSKSRGCNRFHALIQVMDLLRERKEVIARKAEIPDIQSVIDWTKKETKLGNPTLEKYAAEINDPIINQALKWSISINEDIAEMVHDIPPFPFMRESLEKLSSKADAMVISQTPGEALTREWAENDMIKHVMLIAGQEYGTKTEHIKFGAKGKYPDDKILMIGDAPGDMKAAKANGVLFFPINPGHEEDSWEKFYSEGLDKFFDGTFAGSYEEELIKEFNKYLPELPSWKI